MQTKDLREIKRALIILRNDPEMKTSIDRIWQLIKDIIYKIVDLTLDGMINLSEEKAKLQGACCVYWKCPKCGEVNKEKR